MTLGHAQSVENYLQETWRKSLRRTSIIRQTNHMTTSSIYTRKVRGTGETLTIGLAEELGIDAELRYVTVCENHGNIIESQNRELAYNTRGIEFCEGCRAAQAAPVEAAPTSQVRLLASAVSRQLGKKFTRSVSHTTRVPGWHNISVGYSISAYSPTDWEGRAEELRLEWYGGRNATHEELDAKLAEIGTYLTSLGYTVKATDYRYSVVTKVA